MNHTTKKTAPFGSWLSPVSGESLVQKSLRLGQIQIDNSRVYWTEGRPAEKGRTAWMVGALDTTISEINPGGWDVRTRAHEYGGGAILAHNGRYFCVNNADSQLYEISDGGPSQKISNSPDFHFADAVLDSTRDMLFVVGEDHSDPADVKNMLLRVGLDGNGEQHIVGQGHDFYSNPQLSPDGSQLLFITWDHPNMPWDGTQLWMGDLDEAGDLSNLQVIAGGSAESIFQPLWDPNGNIYFVSDKSGWWNLYEYSQGTRRCILEMDAEFGLPQWVFGMSTYAVLSSGKLIASYRDINGSHLIAIDVATSNAREIDTPYSDIDQLQGQGDLISFIGKRHDQPAAIVAMDLDTGHLHVLRRSAETDLLVESISTPELICFENASDQSTYAWFYPPQNVEYEAPEGDKPPLIVLSHGGPTAYSSAAFGLAIQYWTTRGFAIVDVNYSGSTGFGRAYRERLNGNWGILDVDDCVAAAQYLESEGRIDGSRMIIKGGSAGGYTTLSALTFTDVFKAGASYYGIGDLTLLTGDTHKFESRYLDHLVGEYPRESQKYLDRSPLYSAEKLECPVIFFQGLDDPVVPPNQAETMVQAIRDNGIPVAYIPYEGESHGFRRAETIVNAIESEYYFYCRIFGITSESVLNPIEIFNLD